MLVTRPIAISRVHRAISDGRMEGRTDGGTDRRTDGRMDRPSYRDARTHLKTAIFVGKQS